MCYQMTGSSNLHENDSFPYPSHQILLDLWRPSVSPEGISPHYRFINSQIRLLPQVLQQRCHSSLPRTSDINSAMGLSWQALKWLSFTLCRRKLGMMPTSSAERCFGRDGDLPRRAVLSHGLRSGQWNARESEAQREKHGHNGTTVHTRRRGWRLWRLWTLGNTTEGLIYMKILCTTNLV